LTGAPVMFQALVAARVHLRVVTVGHRLFLGSLAARELDWRAAPPNHDRFERVPGRSYPLVAQGARALARRLGLGYSSQDWIIDQSGTAWFLEANPNGQWLFLDRPHEGDITEAIASRLMELKHE
jgi:hypothetical protein